VKTFWLVLAMLVDTLGTGLFGPFDLLYGHAASGLSLSAAGVALSIGTAAAIPAGPLAGSLVDRVGPIPVTVAANAVSVGGSVWLLASHGFFGFLGAMLLLAAGSRAFWAAFSPLVGLLAEGARRDWFGRIRSVRYAGLAGGQALAGAVLLLGQVRGLHLLVAGDGASFVISALIWASLAGSGARDPSPREGDTVPKGYRVALADRLNVGLAASNVLATLVLTAPFLAMPVMVLDQLHDPAWLPGALGALNTVSVSGVAFFAGVLLRGRRRLDVLAFAAVLWGIATGLYLLAPEGRWMGMLVLPLGMALLGVGEALYAPTADAIPLDLAPPGLSGRYSALHQLAWGISGALAPALAAFLLARGPDLIWMLLAGLSFGLGAVYWSLAPRLARRLQPS